VARNCRNRAGMQQEIVLKADWLTVDSRIRTFQKIQDVKFYACPVGCITGKTWKILQMVNDTTDGDCNILHLPYAGTFVDQPDWYKQAVRIVRSARAENQRVQMETRKNG